MNGSSGAEHWDNYSGKSKEKIAEFMVSQVKL